MSDQTTYENTVRGRIQADKMTGEDAFKAWPKTPRLFRDIVITEKIDGTNACIVVTEDGVIYAQSRKKVILPSSDNAGFARWVFENRVLLADKLGPGRHYGEWYGQSIQRKYGLAAKFFMPFNAGRWTTESVAEAGLDAINVVAPTILYQGPFSEDAIHFTIDELRENGSQHVPGQPAEGIIVYHVAAGSVFKVLVENDELPKGVVEGAA